LPDYAGYLPIYYRLAITALPFVTDLHSLHCATVVVVFCADLFRSTYRWIGDAVLRATHTCVASTATHPTLLVYIYVHPTVVPRLPSDYWPTPRARCCVCSAFITVPPTRTPRIPHTPCRARCTARARSPRVTYPHARSADTGYLPEHPRYPHLCRYRCRFRWCVSACGYPFCVPLVRITDTLPACVVGRLLIALRYVAGIPAHLPVVSGDLDTTNSSGPACRTTPPLNYLTCRFGLSPHLPAFTCCWDVTFRCTYVLPLPFAAHRYLYRYTGQIPLPVCCGATWATTCLPVGADAYLCCSCRSPPSGVYRYDPAYRSTARV